MGSQHVNLPKHLWAALDEMSRDGATEPDALMEQAVEHFVALQGYVVPRSLPPPVHEQERSLQDDDDELGLARTQARSALTPELAKELLASPVVTDVSASHKAGPPVITGIAPTHVPVKAKSQLDEAVERPSLTVPSKPRPEPAPTPAAPPAPSAPAAAATALAPAVPVAKAKPVVEAPKPPADPQWVKRTLLSDADEERAAARERMVAIDADVKKLTIERPTTRPLGQLAEEEE